MDDRDVHPLEIMRAIQEHVIDSSRAVLLVESGNAFGWANQCLTFTEPGRYRASMLWGTLGHACAGVIGAAAARGKAVALTGDGGMLFTNELSTAVAHRVRAVWIVLNDARYGSCIAGQSARALSTRALGIPRVDFAAYARSLGADGLNVRTAKALSAALIRAMRAETPFVVDVTTRPTASPLADRFCALFGARGSDGP